MLLERNRLRLAAVFVMVAGASYGVVTPLVKLIYEKGYTFADITVMQFYSSALLLWLLVAVSARYKPKGWRMSRKNLIKMIWLGIVGTLTSIFYYKSLMWLPAWLGVILLFQFAWMTFLVEYIFTRRRPHVYQWIGMLLIVAGTILANTGDIRIGFHVTWLGVALGLLSAVTYSLFLHFNSTIETSSSPFLRSAMIATVSSVVITIVLPPSHVFFVHALHGLLLYGTLVGLLSQAIPTTLLVVGVPQLGGGTAAILSSIELPVAAILSALLLGEPVLWAGWLGVALIFAGMIAGNWSTRVGK